MNVLILNQAFYPDVVSTAQHASDLARALTQAVHEVTVICNSRGYDDPNLRFPSQETWNGVKIVRVRSTGFGKSSKWRRAADFGTFTASCVCRLWFLPHFDTIVAMTSPPLISYIASLAVPGKARGLFFWSMDLNPDEAIAAGWLREGSLFARCVARMLLRSLQRADLIVALDRFMKERIEKKGIPGEKVLIVPPWSHDDHVRFDPAGREQFRAAYKLSDKFVVMYSGNHSPCHPLETLLQAADRLTDRKDIVFCFVGGGSEFARIQERVSVARMRNVLCIPYQPIETLSASLSAADLHVVVMGEPFVGIVHPCKIYNILAASRSFLYIGPAMSHVSDIICKLGLQNLAQVSAHGDVDGVVASILRARRNPSSLPWLPPEVERSFAQDVLVGNVVRALEEYYDKSGDCRYRVTADSNTRPSA